MNDASSPLEQAETAKRRRDITGEVDALMQGHDALKNAPWYPPQQGDLVHVHCPALGDMLPAWGETYEIAADTEGLLSLRLIHHSAPEESFAGAFAPGLLGDPLMEMWMEAGPQAVTVVRAGRCVHPAP